MGDISILGVNRPRTERLSNQLEEIQLVNDITAALAPWHKALTPLALSWPAQLLTKHVVGVRNGNP